MGTSKKNKRNKNKKNVKKNVTFNEPVVNNNNNLGKNKVSILTVSQVKRIPFLHNLSKMIEYQKDSSILEWVITNGSTNDEDFDKFNEEIKKVTCKIPIKHVASKDLKYRNIGAFRNLANRNASGDIIVPSAGCTLVPCIEYV